MKGLAEAQDEVRMAYSDMKRAFEGYIRDPSEYWLAMFEEAAGRYRFWLARLDEEQANLINQDKGEMPF
jgi:hypothetical protein